MDNVSENSSDSKETVKRPSTPPFNKLQKTIPKVSDYDIFQFETTMRRICDEMLMPIIQGAEKDRERVIRAN